MALGRAIVKELDLPQRGATLERWLAHHLAEVLDHVDHADDRDRPALEKRAVELILTLWEKRWSLPAGFGPVSGFSRAIEALDRLLPESNPWLMPGRDDELRDMFDILSGCVVSGILLSLGPNSRALTPEERKALGDDEAALLTTLERWREHNVRANSKLDVEFVFTEVAGASGEENEVGQRMDAHEDCLTERDVPDADRLQAVLIEDLERMQTRLSHLLSRWRKARPDEPEIE